jgi:hypothetical protein
VHSARPFGHKAILHLTKSEVTYLLATLETYLEENPLWNKDFQGISRRNFGLAIP